MGFSTPSGPSPPVPAPEDQTTGGERSGWQGWNQRPEQGSTAGGGQPANPDPWAGHTAAPADAGVEKQEVPKGAW